MGTPISLLKFPFVLSTLYSSERTAAIMSFVVVFPTLPVTAHTGMSKRFLYPLARLKNAFLVSSTIMALLPSGTLISFELKTADAPFSQAFSIKSCPSNFSPFMATNRQSSFTALESVVIYVIETFFPKSLPPQNAAACSVLKVIIFFSLFF